LCIASDILSDKFDFVIKSLYSLDYWNTTGILLEHHWNITGTLLEKLPSGNGTVCKHMSVKIIVRADAYKWKNFYGKKV
jgi:hypothetical protein